MPTDPLHEFAALEISRLEKRFGAVRALAGIDLVVRAGEFVVVLGPTGAGKTTLLRAIAGLEKPEAGSVKLFGRDAADLAPSERDVALVFQNFSLYPSRTVRANLEFPLRAPGRKLSSPAIAERVEWAAKVLKIGRLLERPARQLSGGEMQRVAIGRAIVRRPKLFLMDEPLSNLDAKLREELRIELKELARSLGTPVLWVTHDQAEALSMADRIVVLSEGRVLQDAAPEEVYSRPASPKVARLLGSPPMNVVEARRESGFWVSADGTRLAAVAPSALAPPERATIGFRAEHVEITGGEREARVEVVEDLGPAHVIVARWGGERIHVLAERGLGSNPGDAIHPRVDPARICVWP